MCSRYTITKEMSELKERFSIEEEEYYRPRYNAAPSHLLPVVTLENPERVSFYHWGVTPEWSNKKSISKKLYSILNSEVTRKPSFKKALNSYRCLVPADSFYVWKKITKKREIPYRVSLSNNKLFSMPALYEEYENEDGEVKHTFTIVVSVANDALRQFEDTMPVIFDSEKENIWMNDDSSEDELLDLLAISSEPVDYYPVSPQINDIDKDSKLLIQPSTPADQFGNYSLFD